MRKTLAILGLLTLINTPALADNWLEPELQKWQAPQLLVMKTGYQDFCANYTHICVDTTVNAKLTNTQFEVVKEINKTVNKRIVYKNDTVDKWEIKESGKGDCDDYAVTKLYEVLKAGYPRGAFRIALVKTSDNIDHAILLADTENGTFVLDNLSDEIKEWTNTNYKWIAVEWTSPSTRMFLARMNLN